MSYWDDFDIENRVLEILRSVDSQGHHLGRPFLTAYQIAIEFDRRDHDIVTRLNLPIGGAGVGQRSSLAQYLARELSQRIQSGEMANVEGGFLSSQHLEDISFEGRDRVFHSSLMDSPLGVSIFRLRE